MTGLGEGEPAAALTLLARHVPRVVASFLAAVLSMVALTLAATVLGPLSPFLFALPAVLGVALWMGPGAGLKTAGFCLAWMLVPWLPASAPSVSSHPVGPASGAAFALASVLGVAAVARWAPWPARRLESDLDARLVGSPRMLLVMALAALLPFAAFVVVSHHSYLRAFEVAEIRVDRATRIAQEQASKVFDTSEAMIGRVLDLVGDRTDEDLRARQDALHVALKEVSRDFPQVQSIWVFGADGRPVATSRMTPVPHDSVNIAERDYFAWHREHPDGGFYVSEPHVGKATLQPFFDTSRRREDRQGRFLGTVSVSLVPDYFVRYYAELARAEPDLTMTLIRRDGIVLARHPSPPPPTGAPLRSPAFVDTVRAGRTEGVVRKVRSSIDGVDRVLAFRVVDRYPVFIAASISHAGVIAAWQRELTLFATVLLPMSAILAWVSWIAYRRSVRERAAVRDLRAEMRSRSKAEEALLRSQKTEALGMLTGSVAHDFNNLLAVVTNNAHLIERLAADPRITSLAGAIRRAVASGTHLTRQLLSLSRRQALRPVELDLRASLPGTLELLRTTLGGRIEARLRIEADPAVVRVDEAELELALINLALNARDAMPDGGRLDVVVEDGDGLEAPDRSGGGTLRRAIAIRVTDTGTGMSETVRRLAFEPLFTTKPEGRGTGLGLSQVLSMCQQAGGAARIDSVAGAGTTVTLLLPAVDAHGAPRAPAGAAPGVRRLEGELLLVEDNPEVASATRALLESFGVSVTEADSGAAALAALERRGAPFDAVLSDIMMPGGISGLTLAHRLRERHPTQAVVLMTGYAAEVHAAAAAGFEVLPKPCVPEQLAAVLERALRRDAEVSG